MCEGQCWGDGLDWSPAQQQPKTCCALNTFLPTDTKPSTVRAAMGKIISIQPELQKPFISLPLASPLNTKSLSALAWKWPLKSSIPTYLLYLFFHHNRNKRAFSKWPLWSNLVQNGIVSCNVRSGWFPRIFPRNMKKGSKNLPKKHLWGYCGFVDFCLPVWTCVCKCKVLLIFCVNQEKNQRIFQPWSGLLFCSFLIKDFGRGVVFFCWFWVACLF